MRKGRAPKQRSMNELDALLHAARDAARPGKTTILATVVRVQGSAYRRPGARMLVVAGEGWKAGSISGGCLEGDVVRRGEWLTRDGPRMVRYDTTDDTHDAAALAVGTGCRGVVDVLIERVGAGPLCPLVFAADCLARRAAGVIATVFDGGCAGARLFLYASGAVRTDIANVPLAVLLEGEARDALARGTSLTKTFPSGAAAFVEVVAPPPALVVFGAGHDAVPLVSLAKSVGWHVRVVDGRPSYATRARFPQADAVLVTLPERANEITLEPSTFALVMTHSFRDDLALLQTLLPSPFVCYLGVLGPKSRTEQLLADLRASGVTWTDEQLARLHAPVGLDIGADAPVSVALAALAEMQAVRAGRSGGPLRERNAPIHLPAPSPLPRPTACSLPAF